MAVGNAHRRKAMSITVPISLPALPAEPLVTVMIANYNYAEFLPEAIQSVVCQTYERWELLICDDGSTDGSVETVRRIARGESRISLMKQANQGQAAAWNTLWPFVQGDIVCLLDADDWFAPEKLMRVIGAFDQSRDAGFCVHPLTVVDVSGQRLRRMPAGGCPDQGWLGDLVRKTGGRWRAVSASGQSFRKDLGNLGFPIPVVNEPKLWADDYLRCLAPLLTSVVAIQEELACYRHHVRNTYAGNPATRKSVLSDGCTEEVTHPTIAAVNERVKALGVPGDPLDPLRSIPALETRFLCHALEDGSLQDRLAKLYPLLLLVARDPLYDRARKGVEFVRYTGTALLPRSLRSPFFDGIPKLAARAIPGRRFIAHPRHGIRAAGFATRGLGQGAPMTDALARAWQPKTRMGRLIRLPLRLIGHEREMPVLQGRNRGYRWIVGSGLNHSAWIGHYETWLQDLISRNLATGSTFYDIGANVGYFTLVGARRVAATGQVASFEPLPRNVTFLQRHLRINRIDHVRVFPVALGELDSIRPFRIGDSHLVGRLDQHGDLNVPTYALDSLIHQARIRPPDLMKIDVEGSELEVLQGAISTIQQHRPRIILATHSKILRSRCVEFLESEGYRVDVIQELPGDLADLVASPT